MINETLLFAEKSRILLRGGIVSDDRSAGLYAGLALWAGLEAYQRLVVAGDLLPPTSFG